METQIIELDGAVIEQRLEALSQILADSVAAGASISFMAIGSNDATGDNTRASTREALYQRAQRYLIQHHGDAGRAPAKRLSDKKMDNEYRLRG